MTIYGLIAALIGLFLITRRWFWLIIIGLSALASGFTVLASIIHFEILGAMAFSVLTWILLIIFAAIDRK